MYLPYTSLSRLSNPYSCLTRIRLTISCFDDLLRGLPKLCHRLDARGVRMHSGLLESLSICHNVFRKYRMASLVKFACSVTPTRLARTMHKKCPLYLLAKSMVSRGTHILDIFLGSFLCVRCFASFMETISKATLLGAVFSQMDMSRGQSPVERVIICAI